MKDIEATKKDGRQRDRSFGGLNVIVSGDFWQLDPPSGTALASVPGHLIAEAREYPAAPDVREGLELMWGSGSNSIQGVTELTERVRCEDEWLLDVQEEMRAGELSEDTHAFLHGLPTSVVGTYLRGQKTSLCDKSV